jgi:hypothetical protein
MSGKPKKTGKQSASEATDLDAELGQLLQSREFTPKDLDPRLWRTAPFNWEEIGRSIRESFDQECLLATSLPRLVIGMSLRIHYPPSERSDNVGNIGEGFEPPNEWARLLRSLQGMLLRRRAQIVRHHADGCTAKFLYQRSGGAMEELSRLVELALECQRVSAVQYRQGQLTTPWRITVALDAAPESQEDGGEETQPDSLLANCDTISSLQWLPAEKPIYAREALVGNVLVGRRMFRRIRHRFYCEPIDDLEQEAVYRVWGPAQAWSGLRKRERTAVEGAVGDLIGLKPVHWFAVEGASEACLLAHRIIHCTQRRWPDATIMRWECHESRSHDLLHPIVESLRDLLNLNRRSPGVDLEREIRNWTLERVICTADQVAQITKRLSGLLLGSENDDPFHQLLGYLSFLMRANTGEGAPQVLLVENLQWADELTQKLLAKIVAELRPHSHFILIGVAGTRKRDWAVPELAPHIDGSMISLQLPPARLQEMPEDVRADRDQIHLLRIAGVLGWDFPRIWLRNLWIQLTGRQATHPEALKLAKADFERLLEPLLRAGILRYSGRTAAIGDRCIRYREVKFTAPHIFEAISAQISDDFRTRVVLCFRDLLKEKYLQNTDDGTRFVRRKVVVCDLLSQLPADSLQPYDEFVKLWLLVARRALRADAFSEARRRLACARKLLFDESAASDAQPVLRIADVKLVADAMVLYLRVMANLLPKKEDIEFVAKARAVKAKLPFNRETLSRWFAFSRGLWQWFQRWGSLVDAEAAAQELFQHVVSLPERRYDLELEATHMLAVTLFSRGDLVACLEAATHGKHLCELGPQFPHFNESFLFGSHDGAVCCKIMRAIALLLLTGDHKTSMEEARRARQYADESGHLATRVIARGYQAMALLLANNLDEARSAAATSDLDVDNPGCEKWRKMADLVSWCAGIQQLWQHDVAVAPYFNDDAISTQAREQHAEFREKFKDWQTFGRDYNAIWTAHEGLALLMAGDPDQALIALETSLLRENKRKEHLCLSEVQRVRAIVLHNMRKHTEAAEALRDARQLANGARAILLVERCQATGRKLQL